MSNMLFLCELPDSDKEDFTKTNRSCARTLLRIYFNPEIDCRLVSESVIFTLLSEKGIGPKLYGVFNDGRLEEFIKSKTLQTSDLWQPDMSRRIARKLASLHKLNLPIVKIPTYLTDAMERWFVKLQELKPETCIDVGLNVHVSLGRLHEEFRLIQKAMMRSQSPVVFCHNDLQEGNILSPTENSDSNDLIVIDFEYASYNYRAFDFANHFCEWTFDYTNNSYPFYWFSNENFPDANQQANFFSAYLTTSGQQQMNVQNLIEETKLFVPVSHFFWAIWSLVQNEISPVKFGFAHLNIYVN
uniref:Uncharacterized protein n=1 Tax=Romanomermis culicivorax TaxID=13658 RepID=A0A915IAT3_ROMCU